MTRLLLILRPEPGAAATAERAGARGLKAVTAPLFEIAPVAWSPPPATDFDAVMLTSANAVRNGGRGLDAYRALPLYAVGAATAAAARAAGFGKVIVGTGDAAGLLRTLAGDGIRRLLHLTGRQHRAVEPDGIIIDRHIVYAAQAVRRLPDPAAAALAAGAVTLLHSPRAAALFRRLAEQAGHDPSRLRIATISTAALDVAGTGWAAALAAESPDDEALLAAAARLCD